MNDDKLKKFLKSVDDSRMEKLDIDNLPEPELKSFDEIMPSTDNKKCTKKNLECIGIRRWVALAAAIVLLIIFIPKNNANAGFIKVVLEEKPGHIEYTVIENNEKPDDETEFKVKYVVDGFELAESTYFNQTSSYIFRNRNNDYYKVSRSRLDIGQSGMYSTTGRKIDKFDTNSENLTSISNENSTTIFWFSKYYLYDIVGLISHEEALKLAESIIDLNK